MDKLSAMKAFVCVADTGNFSTAAAFLDLPKSRISQRIQSLEGYLGVRLIERTTRSLKITSAGQIYLDECRRILSDIDRTEQVIRDSIGGPCGRVTIDVLSPIVRWIIAPHIHEFTALYPDIQLSIRSNDVITNIFEENVDIVVRGGQLSDSGLISQHICNVKFGLYATAAIARQVNDAPTPDILNEHRLISWYLSEEKELNWNLQKDGDTVLINSNQHLFVSDYDAALRICENGGGICPAIVSLASSDISNKLSPVLPDWHLPEKPITILYPSRSHLPKRVSFFIDWLKEKSRLYF